MTSATIRMFCIDDDSWRGTSGDGGFNAPLLVHIPVVSHLRCVSTSTPQIGRVFDTLTTLIDLSDLRPAFWPERLSPLYV